VCPKLRQAQRVIPESSEVAFTLDVPMVRLGVLNQLPRKHSTYIARSTSSTAPSSPGWVGRQMRRLRDPGDGGEPSVLISTSALRTCEA
jgi:hypothetical protein